MLSRCRSCGVNAPAAERRHKRACLGPAPAAEDGQQAGVCTRGSTWEDVRACEDCPHYAPPGSGRRHLLCHLLPVAGNGVWRRAVAQIRARRPLFTGRMVFAVATAGGVLSLDPPAAVRRELPPDATVLEVPNDPDLREVASWGPLWDALLPDVGPADAVLYCHGKGATRADGPHTPTDAWASLCWALALDYWPLYAAALAHHPIAGPFKKVGYGFGSGGGGWHYTGAFFWTSAARLKERLAVACPRKWWGVEAWPGLAHRPAEAAAVFHEGYFPKLDLYKESYWDEIVRPEFDAWVRANPPSWPWTAATTPSAGGSSGLSPSRPST